MQGINTNLESALDALRAGEPIIIPTDTVYGLALAPAYASSPEVLFRLKDRPFDKPLPWLVQGKEALAVYGWDLSAYAYSLAERFWPGPLTLIVKASLQVPEHYRSIQGTIGLRHAKHPMVQALLEALGSPLAVTSANRSGRPATSSFDKLDEVLVSNVAAALQDDSRSGGLASTVIDATSVEPAVLRQGPLSLSDL